MYETVVSVIRASYETFRKDKNLGRKANWKIVREIHRWTEFSLAVWRVKGSQTMERGYKRKTLSPVTNLSQQSFLQQDKLHQHTDEIVSQRDNLLMFASIFFFSQFIQKSRTKIPQHYIQWRKFVNFWKKCSCTTDHVSFSFLCALLSLLLSFFR